MTFIAAGDRDGTPYDRCPPGLRGSDNLIADSVSSVHTFPRKKKKKRKEKGRIKNWTDDACGSRELILFFVTFRRKSCRIGVY